MYSLKVLCFKLEWIAWNISRNLYIFVKSKICFKLEWTACANAGMKCLGPSGTRSANTTAVDCRKVHRSLLARSCREASLVCIAAFPEARFRAGSRPALRQLPRISPYVTDIILPVVGWPVNQENNSGQYTIFLFEKTNDSCP